MNTKWRNIIHRLNNYPPGTNRLLPPCSEERLRDVQSEFGQLPIAVIDMLRHFNGAELFDNVGSLLSVFGVSTIPPLPSKEWPEDWYIDMFTPWWRAGGEGRQDDWTIAMMNYGGVVIVCGDGRVREWDTALRGWDPDSFDNLDHWIEKILRRGDDFLKED